MSEIEAAEKRLRVQLNYGGIVHDPAGHKLEIGSGGLPIGRIGKTPIWILFIESKHQVG